MRLSSAQNKVIDKLSQIKRHVVVNYWTGNPWIYRGQEFMGSIKRSTFGALTKRGLLIEIKPRQFILNKSKPNQQKP